MTETRNIPETISLLKKSNTELSRRAAADLRALIDERVAMQAEIEAALKKGERDDVFIAQLQQELKAERLTHNNMDMALREATAMSSVDTLPPVPVDTIALAVAAETKRCAALALGPYVHGWITDRTYEDMDKPKYGEAIRIETARRILAPVAAA